MVALKNYNKPALTLDDMLTLLEKRGLGIKDKPKAANALIYIGYYHFSAYALAFQKADNTDQHHVFHPNIAFDDILDVYTFDRKLRLHVMDAIERIEIALKAALIDYMSVAYGPHWYMDKAHFDPRFDHSEFISKIQQDIQHGQLAVNMRDICIRHYYQNYGSPAMPPVWMVFEALSFSMISRMYKNLQHADKKQIANNFRLPPAVLNSWFHCISYVRNLCAHHQRLWNRVFTISPVIPTDRGLTYIANELVPNKKFYAQAVILSYFMKVVTPESLWNQRLIELIEEYPHIDVSKMGFPKNWQNYFKR